MKRLLTFLLALVIFLVIAGLGAAGYGYYYFSRDLPNHEQLAAYRPKIMTRVYASDGELIAEFARERRIFVPYEAIPQVVVDAFLAAEDKNFFTHAGVDLPSIAAAAVTNLRNIGTGRRPVGASTITQQVAKNFLLTNEVSLTRKVKEALVAIEIERTLEKERILELYLNEIFLGMRSYGVAAAALNYFSKPLDELSVAEAAFLAALPKAPNNYHPLRHPEAARTRRNWVIGQMRDNGFIGPKLAAEALETPLVVKPRDEGDFVPADYFAEEVRRQLRDTYGEDAVYQGGLTVRATLDPALQALADRVLRQGLIDYDQRHGWRGALAKLDLSADWRLQLEQIEPPAGIGDWRLAAVLSAGKSAAEIGLADGATGQIPLAELRWARPHLKDQRIGGNVTRADTVLEPGDVILVERVAKNADGKDYPDGTYALRQMPDVSGGLVAMDPNTGRVLAMAGGISFSASQFNRATQAQRQPGSAFKPFVYLTGLVNGFTPTTLINDAPITLSQGPGLPPWRPKNYSGKAYGPTPLRRGVEKSRNLMTVRLAQAVGMDKVAEIAERFGIYDDLPPHLAQALGAGETTVLRLTAAYAMLANGGKKLEPTLIDRIQDRNGTTLWRHDDRNCVGCGTPRFTDASVPQLMDSRPQIVDPVSAYQIVSILEGVIQRGTGQRLKDLNRPVAGKTGTTNDNFDAWFIGMTPDLVVGAYVGFDDPRTLGPRETGSSAAAPIVKAFLKDATDQQTPRPFATPRGTILVPINIDNGRPGAPGQANVILEAFRPGTEPGSPTARQLMLDDNQLALGGPGMVTDAPAWTIGSGVGLGSGTAGTSSGGLY